MLSDAVPNARAWNYGCGMGYVSRKHSLWSLSIGLVGYDLLRGLVVALSGRFSAASLCFTHARGLVSGFSQGRHAKARSSRAIDIQVHEQDVSSPVQVEQ
jgi:hypothetical protein